MRIEILELNMDVNNDNTKNKATKELIYLPLPIGMLRENHVLNYDTDEYGVVGELVRQNFDVVGNIFKRIGDYEITTVGQTLDDISDAVDSAADAAKKAAVSTAKTIADTAIMNMSKFGVGTILQAQGLAKRPNYALLFRGIEQPRDFTLEWNIFPKTYNDALSIETIIKRIQSAALPDIDNKTWFDKAYELFSSSTTDKSIENDVYSTNSTPVLDVNGLHSVTFKIPNKVKLKIYERTTPGNLLDNLEETDITDITHLMNFPHEMVIQNIIVEHGANETNPTFVKYSKVNAAGDTVNEFFHTTYNLRITLTDTQVTTSNNVNLSI